MKCMKCGREAFKSTNTEALELDGGCLLVIRNIPCYKCRECDEVFYTGDIVQQLEKIKEEAETHLRELTIIDFKKAAVTV